METQELKAEPRAGSGKGAARSLRRQGRLPGICYGVGDALAVSIDTREFLKLRRHSGENAIIRLSLGEEQASERKVLIRELQLHPVTRQPLHVDFLEILLDRELEVSVPVALDGTPVGVERGGNLTRQVREVLVRCLPQRIPQALHLDVTLLEAGQTLHVRDLIPIEGVTVVANADWPLASVVVEKAVEEEAVAGEPGEGEEEAVVAAEGEKAPDTQGRGGD